MGIVALAFNYQDGELFMPEWLLILGTAILMIIHHLVGSPSVSSSFSFPSPATLYSPSRALPLSFLPFSCATLPTGNLFKHPHPQHLTISTSAHAFLPPLLKFSILCSQLTPGTSTASQRLHQVRFTDGSNLITALFATVRAVDTRFLERFAEPEASRRCADWWR